jgi:hypothetical protein
LLGDSGDRVARESYTTIMSTDLMPSPAAGTFDTAILSRAISRGTKPLSRDAAEEILQWDFPPEDQQRMAELSAKARLGEMTAAEEAEIDSYVRVAHIVNLMQAKARLAIQQSSRN